MKASDWISVKDRLPELSTDMKTIKFSRNVLICVNDDEVFTATLVCDKSDNTMFWSASKGGSCYLEEPTHWQPIVLPKQEKE